MNFFQRRLSPMARELRSMLDASDPRQVRVVADALGLDRSDTESVWEAAVDNDRLELAMDLLGGQPKEKAADVAIATLVDEAFARAPDLMAEPVEEPVVRGGPPTSSIGGGIRGRVLEPTRGDGIEILPAARARIEEARSLVATVDRSYMRLARLLATMVDERVHAEVGYGDGRRDVEAFFEQELGLGERKGFYLLSIGRAFVDTLFEDELTALGWTKAAQIARLPLDEHEEAIDRAEEMTVRQLTDYVRSRLEGQVVERAPMRRLSFTMPADRASIVEAAIERAKKRAGSEISDEFALEMALGEWLGGENMLTLEQSIEQLERRFAVRLVQSA